MAETVELRHSERLRRRIQIAHPQLAEASRRFWNHEDFASLYPEYQYRAFCISRALVEGLRVAGETAKPRAVDDPVCRLLSEYFERHIPEEVGHDEMILADIEVLGVSREATLKRMAPPSVAALVGSQYYWARHHHPIAFMGYLAVLETDISKPLLEKAISRSGLPREAFRFLLFHAHVEPAHIDDIDRTLDSLPLREEHFRIMSISALTTLTLAARVYEEICS